MKTRRFDHINLVEDILDGRMFVQKRYWTKNFHDLLENQMDLVADTLDVTPLTGNNSEGLRDQLAKDRHRMPSRPVTARTTRQMVARGCSENAFKGLRIRIARILSVAPECTSGTGKCLQKRLLRFFFAVVFRCVRLA